VTDLHTHILPGIDDGAQTIEESISLLRAEIKSGVNTVALTPHFDLSAAEQSDFIIRRNKAYNALSDAIRRHNLQIELILGAEVKFSHLPDLDLDTLCYEGTKIILVELPMDHYPLYTQDVLYRIQLDGYVPLIAHAERYTYFTSKPDLLEKLIRSGTLIQVNANGLLKSGKTRKRILKMIANGFVHVLATDTHSMDMRPPRLDKAIKVIEKKLGTEAAQRLVNFEL
jgi:protein-tyrosine phosphatase